jgi:hypothetical protein
MDTIIRAPHGTHRRSVPIDKITVPDLWHIAMTLQDKAAQDQVLECWYLCHDLLANIIADGDSL